MHETLKNLVAIVLLAGCTFGSAFADGLLRDPTRPYSATERRAAAAPRFIVSAIIVSNDRRVAIVNGQRVGVGGSVDNATVVSIEKQKLVLETNGKQMTIGLHDKTARK